MTLSHQYNVVWHSHTLHIEEEGSGNTSTNKLCLVAVIPAINHKPCIKFILKGPPILTSNKLLHFTQIIC